jgi:probable HAF family extracellular repeat protein
VGYVYENGHSRLFLWDRAHGMQDLGFAGWACTINNAGQISGTMQTDPNCEEVFLWEPDKGRTILGTLGGKRSSVYAMNNRGQIVGMSNTADGKPRAFLWDKKTGVKELPRLAGTQYIPVSINDAGRILIMAIKQTPSLSYDYSWFLLDPNGAKPVTPLPPDTWLQSMNANSCMVATGGSGSSKPYLYIRNQQGELKRLFPYCGEFESATRLNDKNQIACSLLTNHLWEPLRIRFLQRLRFFRPRLPSFEKESYLWDPVRGRIPLDRYLEGIEGFIVEDLNNDGCIIGTGHREDGSPCSVLLEPIPERWGK